VKYQALSFNVGFLMVCDPFWQKSFETGEIIEEVILRGHRAVLIKGSSSIEAFIYPFRMFIFHQESNVPCLILSLEIGLRFGTCALGAHTQTEHINYGPAEPNMSLGDFKSWALSTAENYFL
jgi:hypothetical protein